MRTKRYLCGLGIALLLSGGCAGRKNWHSSTLFFFDTVCDINLCCGAEEYKSLEKEISDIFSRVEASFAPGAEDYSSLWVIELFGPAKQLYLDSGGAFDVTVGSLSRLWGFHGGTNRLPSAEEIQSELEHVGMDKITVENGRLSVPAGMAFDWGGIAKGFGVDLAAKALLGGRVKNGFINAGGDLYCWGTNPEGKPWRVGIKSPRREGFFGVLNISGVGAATSGDYQRYFEESGVRYHHIFDPKTGYPARGKQSVTIVGPETTICDALSTAVFVHPKPEELLGKYPDYGAIIVDEKGKYCLLGKTYGASFVQ